MKKTRRRKRSSKSIALVITCMLLLIFLMLFYGPFENFRILWINTAMNTSKHTYLATLLYSDSYIEEVMNASFELTTEITNSDPLETNYSDSIISAAIKGDRYKGWIIKLSDPTRLDLYEVTSENGLLLEQIVQDTDSLGGINASGYETDEKRGLTWGYTIVNGECIHTCSTCADGHTIGGLNQENKLIVGELKAEEIAVQNYRWAIEFGPILIVNGNKADIPVSSGGLAPRTAIGQTAQGEILLLVVDGRQITSIGATFSDLQEIMYRNGAINAIALDGGSSSSMAYQGQLINNPSDIETERLLPNAIIFR